MKSIVMFCCFQFQFQHASVVWQTSIIVFTIFIICIIMAHFVAAINFFIRLVWCVCLLCILTLILTPILTFILTVIAHILLLVVVGIQYFISRSINPCILIIVAFVLSFIVSRWEKLSFVLLSLATRTAFPL